MLTVLYLLVLVGVLLYPFQFSPPDLHKPFLSFNKLNTEGLPFLVSNSNIMDAVRNIGFFIPFGVFLFAWLHRSIYFSGKAVFLTLVAAGFVSVLCEALQFFLPVRSSAIFDVAANLIGAAAGATGCQVWFFRSGQYSGKPWIIRF